MRPAEETCPAIAGHVHRAASLEQSTNRERDACPYPTGIPTCSPTGRDLGRAIRQLRRERGLTIEELGFAAGVHPTYLSGIERGVRNPSWEKACALAHGLGIPIANLSAHAESTARIRQGTEDILEQERALLARQPPDWARADAA
jgi:transcriptional regulator with XRE-family HTH domain